MSKGTKNLIAVIGILIIGIVAITGIAWAQGEIQTLYPSVRLVSTDGELVFEGWFIENDGMNCVQMSNGSFFCCCGAGCSVEVIEVCEGDECYKVTPTPPIPPTDTPETPDKEKCNRGIGNNSEGCDPGTSSGQGGGSGRDAGEDRDENKKDKKDK